MAKTQPEFDAALDAARKAAAEAGLIPNPSADADGWETATASTYWDQTGTLAGILTDAYVDEGGQYGPQTIYVVETTAGKVKVRGKTDIDRKLSGLGSGTSVRIRKTGNKLGRADEYEVLFKRASA